MVLNESAISDTLGGFNGALDDDDGFGISVAALGDVDGDGVADIATGAIQDDDGGTDRGAIWILFMNADGTVRDHNKISSAAGGFTGALSNRDYFGISVASIGDLDVDGVPDLAAGAFFDDDGGVDRGAVWILFLNTDGTVKAHQKISNPTGGFSGALDDNDRFGIDISTLGDLDGDTISELAVGAYNDDDGGLNRGAVWILFMNRDGTVKTEQKISETEGGFVGALDDYDFFGVSVAGVGDLDQDGRPDLAVGAVWDDDGGPNRGAVWVLFMNADGTVRAEQKISGTEGGFSGVLHDGDYFGGSVDRVGDLDGDGVTDIITGAHNDDDGGTFPSDQRGAVWVLFMNSDGTVRDEQKISDTAGGFNGVLDNGDYFGVSVTSIGDLDADGRSDIAVGAYLDDDGGPNRGAIWILSLDGCPVIPPCCPGNADGLGTVNFADITSVLTHFGSVGTHGQQNPGDADCDGVVNFADVTSVLTFFNSACR
jgi:hypothetical protein